MTRKIDLEQKYFSFRWTSEIREGIEQLLETGLYRTKTEIIRRALTFGLQIMEEEDHSRRHRSRKSGVELK